MTFINRAIGSTGSVDAKLIKAQRAPWRWRLSNYLRSPFIRSWIGVKVIVPLARKFGIMTAYGELRAVLIKGDTGERVNYGLLSYRVITDTGVTFMRDDFNNNAQDITTLNFHGCGTGTGNEAAGDTGLGTESTTALNPDNTRATGTRSTPAANQFRSIGTLTFDANTAVTEHGILSQAATGGGTLWDRSKFAAINVDGSVGDSIQFTYTLTLTSGG
jgi:hypothetical protein